MTPCKYWRGGSGKLPELSGFRPFAVSGVLLLLQGAVLLFEFDGDCFEGDRVINIRAGWGRTLSSKFLLANPHASQTAVG